MHTAGGIVSRRGPIQRHIHYVGVNTTQSKYQQGQVKIPELEEVMFPVVPVENMHFVYFPASCFMCRCMCYLPIASF